MENNRGELHKHGSGRLQERVQSCMGRTNVEASAIHSYEITARLGDGLDIFGKTPEGWDGCIELGTKGLTSLLLYGC
nr:MAG TPA: hypothetical protein [Caudoviricetes sp.]